MSIHGLNRDYENLLHVASDNRHAWKVHLLVAEARLLRFMMMQDLFRLLLA